MSQTDLNIEAVDALATHIYSLIPQDPALFDAWLHNADKSHEVASAKAFWTKCYIEIKAEYKDKVNEDRRRLKEAGVSPMEARIEAIHINRRLFRLYNAADSFKESYNSKYWTLIEDGIIKRG